MATGDVLSGAGQGATAGAAFGPYGAAIGAGIGAIGGFFGGKKKKKAQKKAEKARKEAIRLAGPEHLKELVQLLQPVMRNIVASGLGPQFQQEILNNISAHGMTGTGVGETLRNAASAVPETFAASQSLSAAQDTQRGEVSAALGGLPFAGGQTANPLLDALVGGAQAYFATKRAAGSSGIAVPPAQPRDIPNPGPQPITPGAEPSLFPTNPLERPGANI